MLPKLPDMRMFLFAMFSIFFAEITALKLLSQDHLDHLEDLEDLDDLENSEDSVAPHAPKLGQANVTSDLELAEDDAEDDQEEEEDQVEEGEVEDEDEEEDASQLGMLQTNRTLSSASRRRIVYGRKCYWSIPLKNLEITVKQEGRLKAWRAKYPYQWTRPFVRLRFQNQKNEFKVTHWRRVKEYRFRVKGNKLCASVCMESKRMRNRFHQLVHNDPRGVAVKC